MPFRVPIVLRCLPWLLAGAAGFAGTGCAMRPGYVDSATGRAYAGFAKPACYATDFCGLLGVKECDCGRHPYTPPVAAFTSFPGLQAGCCLRKPTFVTTQVYAPPPARYEDYQGNPALQGPPRGRRPAPPAPSPRGIEPNVTPAPMPLPSTLGEDAPGDGPGLPETTPEGIGV